MTKRTQKSKVVKTSRSPKTLAGYKQVLSDVVSLLEESRRSAARSVNTIMTATYWLIGCRIVTFEQKGKTRAEYGTTLIKNLAKDLTQKFGRGFGRANLFQMRAFYLAYSKIIQTPSGLFKASPSHQKVQTLSEQFDISSITSKLPLSWSHYVRILSVEDTEARSFYETEALRGGWSVRQLDRQISSQFYERTALSRNKTAMLKKGQKALPQDLVTPEEAIKDPFVLEFLGLKDEYSESELEEALILQLEKFLLELGGDFAFIGRQRRLRIGNEWYRVDLLFFHRKLKCLVVIDLKIGKFTHADAGQMHMYLNYAREHWTHEGENPPVGLILCAQKDKAVAKYSLEGLPNKVLAAEYRTTLPDTKTIAAALQKTRARLQKK